MKLNKRMVVSVLALIALMTGTMFGTMAYLTDKDTAVNTFTVGKVEIELDETDVKVDGTRDTEERVKENVYHLIPGTTYIKDPTIHVAADSEDCYLFVTVDNKIAGVETKEDGKTIADQMKRLDWVKVNGVAGMDNLYILAKGGADKYAVSKGAAVVVFENFTIDGASVTNESLAELDKNVDANKAVIVTAYAVQKAGFEDMTPQQIWTAVFAN